MTRVPEHRGKLDVMVVGLVRLTVLVGLLSGVVMLLAFRRPGLGIAPISTMILAANRTPTSHDARKPGAR